MDDAMVAALGRQLYELERSATPRSPLSEEFPGLDVEAAYAIQEAYARLRLGDGTALAGRKIGCTSVAIQQLFNIDTPDFGHLFADMQVEDGGTIESASLIAPMVEPEVAFLLQDELAGPGLTGQDVLAATAAILPCIEIIDSRIEDWRIAFVDTVADNGSSARFVLGSPARHDGHDLAAIRVTLRKDGAAVASGSGEAVLGHPADSVAWLANALAPFGRSLGAGEYVLSGSMTTAIRAGHGDRFDVVFDGLGSVGCAFV
jgi:2-oxopent-4-enoate hydratase